MSDIQYKRSTDFVGFATQDWYLDSSGNATTTATDGVSVLVKVGQKVSAAMKDAYAAIVVTARYENIIVPSTEPTVIVSLAGSSIMNGVYTQRGFHEGLPFYNKVGARTDPGRLAISYFISSTSYKMFDDGEGQTGNVTYSQNTGSVDRPWLDTWNIDDGNSPAPTVEQGPT